MTTVLQAIVRLRTTHAHIQHCIELFESLPEVVEAFRVTGEGIPIPQGRDGLS